VIIVCPSTGGLLVADSDNVTTLWKHDEDGGYFVPADTARLKLRVKYG
jgi:predicted Rdx family selenoprotein